MKVARVHGAGDLRLHEENMPAPRPGETLVRVTAVGICGSDVHWWKEGAIGSDRIIAPLVLGHECAGVIESGPKAGRRVAINPACPCGKCEFCREGNPNLCSMLHFAGHAPDEGFVSACDPVAHGRASKCRFPRNTPLSARRSRAGLCLRRKP